MLTVVGEDRKGIVAALTRALYEGGANLGETSMVRLGGNFTIMMMVEYTGNAGALKSLVAPAGDRFGLSVHVDPIQAHLHRHVEPRYRVTLHGADRAGIVSDVTGALADLEFNITDLESDVGGNENAPIYILHIEGVAPVDLETLQQAIEKFSQAWNVSVRVSEIDSMIA